MPKKLPKKQSLHARSTGARKQAAARSTSPKKKSVGKQEHAGLLKGWKQIAEFLGQPVATAQRWAKTGMPAHREGRFMVATPEELSAWLGREAGAGQPVHIATDNADLSADLRRALAAARHHQKK